MYAIKIIFIAALLFAAACNSNKKENDQSRSQPYAAYPAIVESLGVQQQYDQTKWQLYLLKCDDTPRLGESGEDVLNPPRSFGSLALKFDSLWHRNDTTAFYFDFYVNDTQSLLSLAGYRYLKHGYYSGMLFYKGQDSLTVCYVSNHSSFPYDCIKSLSQKIYDTTTYKLVKPLQPEVIQYINKNKEQLHPWFYQEAKKRGVIKE